MVQRTQIIMNKDKLPSSKLYQKYLNIASIKFSLTLDQCRDKFGLLTINEWETTLKEMITYKGIGKEHTYDEYMKQFVNENTKRCVLAGIGLVLIKSSKDKDFNDIPLKYWDNCYLFGLDIELLKATGNSYTLSTKVSILKASARALKAEHTKNS